MATTLFFFKKLFSRWAGLACCPFLLFIACQDKRPALTDTQNYIKLVGETMWTSYHITYKDEQGRNLKQSIDSLLEEINLGASPYIPTSTISRFNRAEREIIIKNEGAAKHFIKNIVAAKAIVEKTEGFFDPTVAPIVNYWGFGFTGKKPVLEVDSAKIDSLLNFVGFDKISIENTENQFFIKKEKSGVQLDFSAIAKGYGVDEVGRFLEFQKIDNYLVEIGGEVRARGKNPKGNWWKIAIKKPTSDAAEGPFMDTPYLKNRSMATSGNYENFRVINGQKQVHTMNPKTGFFEINDLLSATVFADDCIIADSYATGFMAMGAEKAYNLAEKLPEIEAYLVYFNENQEIAIKYTKGLKGLRPQ